MADKTIRYTVDDKGVIQSNNRIRESFEDTQKRLVDSANSGRKVSKDELEDIKEKIRLIKELHEREESARRSRINEARVGRNDAQISYDERKRKFIKIEEDVPELKNDPKWRSQVSQDLGDKKQTILDERRKVLSQTREYNELRETNKKQVRGLEEVVGTLNKNTDKSIRSTEQTFSSVFRGATNGPQGAIGSLGMLGAAGGVAALVIGTMYSSSKKLEDELKVSSVKLQMPMIIAKHMAISGRDTRLAMSGSEVLSKMATFSGPSGRYMGVDETKGLVGAQISRGFSDEQIGQLLKITRYSGTSTLGSISNIENYTKARDGNLSKLPELIEQYLRSSNEILNRTGRVDALGVQQSIMSVGKSYNVSGLQLDKTMGGLTKLSTLSDNPVLLSLQQQAFRKLYPTKSPWEMTKMLSNPAENPELMKSISEMVSKFGGGGDYTKFGMASMGVDPYTVDRIVEGKLKIEPKAKKVSESGQKGLEEQAQVNASDYIGNMSSIANSLGIVMDLINGATLTIEQLFDQDWHNKLKGTLEKGTYEGTKQAMKEGRN